HHGRSPRGHAEADQPARPRVPRRHGCPRRRRPLVRRLCPARIRLGQARPVRLHLVREATRRRRRRRRWRGKQEIEEHRREAGGAWKRCRRLLGLAVGHRRGLREPPRPRAAPALPPRRHVGRPLGLRRRDHRPHPADQAGRLRPLHLRRGRPQRQHRPVLGLADQAAAGAGAGVGAGGQTPRVAAVRGLWPGQQQLQVLQQGRRRRGQGLGGLRRLPPGAPRPRRRRAGGHGGGLPRLEGRLVQGPARHPPARGARGRPRALAGRRRGRLPRAPGPPRRRARPPDRGLRQGLGQLGHQAPEDQEGLQPLPLPRRPPRLSAPRPRPRRRLRAHLQDGRPPRRLAHQPRPGGRAAAQRPRPRRPPRRPHQHQRAGRRRQDPDPHAHQRRDPVPVLPGDRRRRSPRRRSRTRPVRALARRQGVPPRPGSRKGNLRRLHRLEPPHRRQAARVGQRRRRQPCYIGLDRHPAVIPHRDPAQVSTPILLHLVFQRRLPQDPEHHRRRLRYPALCLSVHRHSRPHHQLPPGSLPILAGLPGNPANGGSELCPVGAVKRPGGRPRLRSHPPLQVQAPHAVVAPSGHGRRRHRPGAVPRLHHRAPAPPVRREGRGSDAALLRLPAPRRRLHLPGGARADGEGPRRQAQDRHGLLAAKGREEGVRPGQGSGAWRRGHGAVGGGRHLVHVRKGEHGEGGWQDSGRRREREQRMGRRPGQGLERRTEAEPQMARGCLGLDVACVKTAVRDDKTGTVGLSNDSIRVRSFEQ
ncbi:hypothetical protein CTA2_6763, partial [Colletotrichum tanaceti]